MTILTFQLPDAGMMDPVSMLIPSAAVGPHG